MTETEFLAAIWLGRAILFLGLIWAAYVDSLARRIPNALSLALLLVGLLWHSTVIDGAGLVDATSAGGLGLKLSALGAAIAFGVFFIFYLLGVYGAGDVKLLTAIGAWVGPFALLPLTLLVLICGGALSLARMLEPDRRTRTLLNLRIIGVQAISVGTIRGAAGFDPKTDSADRLPYAWAILGGTALYGVAFHFGWWSWL